MRKRFTVRSIATWAVLLGGPYTTLRLLENQVDTSWLRADQLGLVTAMALVMWSPVFFSFPALLLQRARDAALPELTGVVGSSVRAVRLVPYLLSPASTVRLEMALSLIGFAIGALYATVLL